MSRVEENRARNRSHSGRDTCARCARPRPACYCAHVVPLKTRTRLVILQHPRERDVKIGTARMASLCLEGSELHVGVDWSRSASLARALSDPERPPILLYPGEDAIDIVKHPPPGPVTLVVVDGTWSQTRKVVKTNPVLAALPRYAFVPPNPSEYRIRKEPDLESVSTIEALVHTLSALEEDPARFTALLAPFRAMIDYQIECQERIRGARVRHAKFRARERRRRVPRAFDGRYEDIVIAVGEASSWAYADRAKDPRLADELIHWAAHRPSTGETMSFLVKPTRALSPGTPKHTGLDEALLATGGTHAELHARWRAFVRDTDVVCSWGKWETSLFTNDGGFLPPGPVDLRQVTREVTQGNVHSLRSFPTGVDGAVLVGGALVPGRAGKKLAALVDVVAALVAVSPGAR
ncbi:MAG: DTW domain-containing protein [Labilithrix sp.]|nr:DTW domain-containing protein [Labilithrix sp.]MCW5815813.1 DTW domain-containing protein [Labilithrix sp.]